MQGDWDRLRFIGKVIKGAGKFSEEIIVPGNADIPDLIRDWPDELQPGTLNVLIDSSGFPARYVSEFDSAETHHLDTRRFQPEAELPHSKIGNNTLSPKPGERPDKGNAQIWRACLTKIETGISAECWVLRRICSQMPKRLECVAGVKLRDVLSLREEDNDAVELVIEGKWGPSRP